MTVLAGVFALIAGVLAFGAAYVGAKIQVEVTKKSYEAKVSSYRFRMEYLAKRLMSNLHRDKELISRPHGGAAKLLQLEQSQPGRTMVADEFLPIKWEEHSMLGSECVAALVAAYESITEFNKLKAALISELQISQDYSHLADKLADLLAAATDAEAAVAGFVIVLETEPTETPYEAALRVISRSMIKIVAESVPVVGHLFR